MRYLTVSKSLVYLSPKTKLLSKLIQAAAKIGGETLESVSLCTRFSGFSTISSFSFNRLGSKLVMVSMFLEIVPMFVAKDFARRHFVAQIYANSGAYAHFCATKQSRTKSLSANIGTIPKTSLPIFSLNG